MSVIKDREGTPLREYFRAIVHNIEHLNTEAALNTARSGLKALDNLEDAKSKPGPSDIKCAFCDTLASFIINRVAVCSAHRANI
jgi:hypothetical protein